MLKTTLSFFFAKILANKLINLKISSSSYNFEINDFPIKEIPDFLKVILIKNITGLEVILTERSEVENLLRSICELIIFSFLFGIVFLIFSFLILKIKRKLLKYLKYTNQNSKYNGLAIGFFKGFLVILLITIPLAGISSITNEILKIENIKINEEKIILLKDYRKTISGRLFKFLKIKQKPLDLYYFDETFLLKHEDKKIYLSKEVEYYVDIVNYLQTHKVNFSLSDYNETDLEVINTLALKLSKTNSLNITSPIVIDYILINYYDLKLSNNLYKINYYNDLILLKDLLKLYYENKEITTIEELDFNTLYTLTVILSNLDLLDKLSYDITTNLEYNQELYRYLSLFNLNYLSFDEINLHEEINYLRQVLEFLFLKEEINLEMLANIINKSKLINKNQRLILEIILETFLIEYRYEITRSNLTYDDYLSLLKIGYVFIENGYFEPYFRLSKLYDEKSVNVIVDAIFSSPFLRNNLEIIVDLFLSDSMFTFKEKIIVPRIVKDDIEIGKMELKRLIRLCQILNYGLDQEIESNLEEIKFILETSYVIKQNLNKFLHAFLSYYNETNYEIYLIDIDYNSEEGNIEFKKLIDRFCFLIENKLIFNPTLFFSLTKDEIDYLLDAKVLEEALINLLIDIGKESSNPLVVNIPKGHEDWYISHRGKGELRYFLYALRIIFKDIDSFENISFTKDLILKINDGTIDTNGDGVIDEKDENELYEIMQSKIISDTIIKFLYDYIKEME